MPAGRLSAEIELKQYSEGELKEIHGEEFDNRQCMENGSVFFTALHIIVLFADIVRYGGFVYNWTV